MTGTEVSLAKDVGVDVRSIEDELAALWRNASSEERQVTRACSWNLVVVCADDATFATAKPVVDTAVRHVPSRTLVLKPRPRAAGREIEAWVTANCQIAPGGGKLLCTEEITVEARGPAGAEHLPSLIRALLVPDVPTALWWAGAPPTDPGDVRLLWAGVDRLIFDSRELSFVKTPGDSLAKLAHVGGMLEGLVLADLNWLRTASLRSLLASLFDPPVGPEPLARLNRVRVACTAVGVPAARLLLGWMASRLGWSAPEREGGALAWRVAGRGGAPVRLEIDPQTPRCQRDSGISAVRLETSRGEPFALLEAEHGACTLEHPGLLPRTVAAAELAAAQLLVAALGSRGRDWLYPVALHRAIQLR